VSYDDKLEFFRKTDAVIVYNASDNFAEELLGTLPPRGMRLFIHVGRDKGSVVVYKDNDTSKLVPIKIEHHECILQLAEPDR
jgi:hypothetical protein